MSQTESAIELAPFQNVATFSSTVTTNGTTSSRAAPAEQVAAILSKNRSIITIAQLASISFVSSMTNGILVVGLPRIAVDLALPEHLLLWPSSVYSLTTGSCLLLAGSVADVVGSRLINLMGSFFLGCFILACGVAQTGIQLIIFRSMQGIAMALVLPTGVGIISNSITSGKRRNIGSACLGLGQPLGYSVGLVLGGIFIETLDWRFGYYLSGAACLSMFLLGNWALPRDISSEGSMYKRLAVEIDWVGGVMASTCLAALSYVLAAITASVSNLRQPLNIVLLVTSIALVPAFIYWVGRQEKRQNPALIPNYLWKNIAFSSVCVMVFLSWAVLQTGELFSSLFFQNVQHLSALQASLRLLPSFLVGTLLNLTTGIFVDKFSALHLVLISSLLSTISPLLLAVINPNWPYWYDAFFAQLLQPLSIDVLFTIGILIVSSVFPPRTQALAGAVFNTVAQFGLSMGLAAMAIISTYATKGSGYADKNSAGALMVGYRASFWAAFAWMLLACVVGAFGLRNVGKVGLKTE